MKVDASIRDLKRLHQDGQLCLFVGAGISKSCGLPGWEELSKRVIDRTWPDKQKFGLEYIERSARSSYSPLDAMRLARRELKTDFNSAVFECLYPESVCLSPTVKSITALRNVHRVICSNYDDLLEEGYQNQGVSFQPLVRGDNFTLERDRVLIFHPHGFLPRRKYSRDYLKEPIVLSEDDYHDLYATPYSWPNLIQLHLFMSFNVLFVGCSLRDPNIRRLLDSCKTTRVPSHFVLLRVPNDSQDWFDRLLHSFPMKVETENLADRGITPVWYKDHADVASILDEIAQI